MKLKLKSALYTIVIFKLMQFSQQFTLAPINSITGTGSSIQGPSTNVKFNSYVRPFKRYVSMDMLDDGDDESKSSAFDTFRNSPGALVLAPFLLLFGFDIILNIAVITKRSLEVLFTGEYTVWNPFE